MLTLHETLLLGTPGRLLMGAVGLLWTADCFVGLLLTLPRVRPMLPRWLPARSVKRTTNPFRLCFDLRRAGGAVAGLAGSGVWLWWRKRNARPRLARGLQALAVVNDLSDAGARVKRPSPTPE